MRFPLLILLVGCMTSKLADETPVDLTYYPELHISVGPGGTRIILGGPGESGSRYAPCPAPGPLTTRLGEVSATVVEPGGKIGESPGDDVADNECGPPIYAVPGLPPDGATRLTIADATASLSCPLPDLKATREATAPSWDWHVGQLVTVSWAPADDVALWRSFQVTIQRLDLQGTIVASYPVDVTLGAGLLRFTVPAITPTPVGPFRVDFIPTQIVSCAPSAKPAYLQSTLTQFSVSRPVTILP